MRSKFSDLALEALLVVFAVMVALAVEEYREERQLQDFADRARIAVVAEVQANVDEMILTGPGLDSTAAKLGGVLESGDMAGLAGDISFTLPEISTAAWRAAQVSRAAPYLDYEWMIQVSRAYEVYDTYRIVGNQAIEAMTLVIGAAPTNEGVRSIYGRLIIISGVHEQLLDRLEAIVEAEEERSGG